MLEPNGHATQGSPDANELGFRLLGPLDVVLDEADGRVELVVE